jgi:hypothetical protein
MVSAKMRSSSGCRAAQACEKCVMRMIHELRQERH